LGLRPAGFFAAGAAVSASAPVTFMIWSITVSFFARGLGLMPSALAIATTSSRSFASKKERSMSAMLLASAGIFARVQ
jgi:hypothetical protein